MMSEKFSKNFKYYASQSSWRVFRRAGWKHFLRWVAFVFLVGLNIAMPMSLIERLLKHAMVIQAGPEALQFVFLLFCDLYFLPGCFFEVNWLAIKDDELVLANLVWTVKLNRTDIVSVQMPTILIWLLLRTRRCFYLINKADMPNFDELASLIEQKYLL